MASFKKNQVMSLFIIIIIALSSAAFVVVLAGNEAQKNPELPPLPPENPTSLKYTASNLDASVVQVFSSLLMTGQTKEAVISNINSEISRIESNGKRMIRSINSSYRMNQDTSLAPAGSLIYVANLTFDSSFTSKGVIDAIKEKTTFLDGIEGYGLGLVSLPKEVEITNLDLNLSRSYTFENPLTQAFISIDTMSGDNIKVELEMELIGEQQGQIAAFESENVSGAQQPVLFSGEFTISSLEPRLEVTGRMDYSKTPEEQALKGEISALNGVQSVDLNISKPLARLKLNFNQDFTQKQGDLNQSISSIEGVTAISFLPDSNSAQVSFSETADLTALKQKISAAATASGFSSAELVEPKSSLSAALSIDPALNSLAWDDVNALLFSQGIEAIATQPAFISASLLSVPDSNESFEIDGASGFNAAVNPTHKEGDLVNLQVFFFSFRGKAISIQAMENSEQ
ncbi:MAG: hypothetical protein V1494_05585 [Candidatus Diapherotrites archaeon]